jgi:hypothetical protein
MFVVLILLPFAVTNCIEDVTFKIGVFMVRPLFAQIESKNAVFLRL